MSSHEPQDLTVRTINYTHVALAIAVVVGGVLVYKLRSPRRPTIKPTIQLTPENSAEFFVLPPRHGLDYRNVTGNLTTYSILGADPAARQWVKELDSGNIHLDPRSDRAMAVLVGNFGSCLQLTSPGNVIGDALGAPFEFSPVEYGTNEMKIGFEESDIWTRGG